MINLNYMTDHMLYQIFKIILSMFLKKHGKQTYGRKQSATDTFKTTSKSVIQKTAEETGDLIETNRKH